MTNQPLDVIALGACYVDINADNFPFNRDNITSEEFKGERYEMVAGGSAVNFCRLGQMLGLQTAFIGMAGNDLNGDILQRLLTQHGIQAALIRQADLLTHIDFNITTTQGDHIIFGAGTANAALDPVAVMPRLEELVPEAKILYLGGCLKLKAFKHAFQDITRLARQHSTKLVVDHGRIPEGVSQDMLTAVRQLVLGSSYYFPSREEFCGLWEVPDIATGLRKLQERTPDLVVVVKDGANGAFYWADGAVRHMKVTAIDKVVNVTGAGDSFNAGAIAALLDGRALPDAIAFGNEVAAAKIKAEALPLLQ